MPGILVVEDDENLNRGITFSLKKSGYEVFSAESVKKAKRIASDNNVDVTICDVNLPDGNGLEFVRWMRCNYNTYIICLTALDQEIDQVMGYEAGADDYITKPFSLSVLLLKIEAYFRRRQEKTEAGKMISGDIVFIAGEMKVLIKSREISLTKTELKMLTFFLQNPKQILSKTQILENVFDLEGDFVDENTIAVNIRRLREKIEDNPATGLYKEYQRSWVYMESGGKAVTKRCRKKITVVLSLVLPVILLFAILNCFTTYVFYEDYKYKMNLMTEIAAKEEFSGLDAVSELLKDKGIETNEQGRRLLEQYGYWGNKGNAFYSQFRHQVMVTGAVSTVICVLLLTFLLYWKKKEDACHQKILDQLEEILIRFRENKFGDLLKTENHAELEKLNDQLEAIGHHIQLIKEEARAEKENTKEMVSDISHQLKTPVAALDTCFSVLMQNDLSATEQEEFRIRCRSALDGLETLLQSLLEISKMETGLIQINKKKLPLMDTVISAVNRIYPKADEKEIEFVFDYEKELETCTIMQDKRWLGEAVINVLDNAVKYSPCGSKIFIRLQKRNYLVRMEIEDQGIGIPQNEYHKIFQRFYRGSSKEVMENSGTGIGLFLSREIIEKHAGTITVTSGKKKKGSTFVIQLPYVG